MKATQNWQFKNKEFHFFFLKSTFKRLESIHVALYNSGLTQVFGISTIQAFNKKKSLIFLWLLELTYAKTIHIMKSASRQRPQRQRKATRSSPSSAYQKRIKPYKRLFSLRLIGGINILKYIIEHVTMCTRHQSLITSRFRMPKIVHKWTTRFLWFPVHDFSKSHTIQIERTFE